MSIATGQDTMQLVVFSLADAEYALPIRVVKEIIRYTEPQPTASSIPWMRGVINLRGGVIPVVDLATRLGSSLSEEAQTRAKILIVEFDDRYTGVIVTDVDEVRTINLDQVSEAPQNSAEFIDGIARIDERLIMLLDVERLLGGV